MPFLRANKRQIPLNPITQISKDTHAI